MQKKVLRNEISLGHGSMGGRGKNTAASEKSDRTSLEHDNGVDAKATWKVSWLEDAASVKTQKGTLARRTQAASQTVVRGRSG